MKRFKTQFTAGIAAASLMVVACGGEENGDSENSDEASLPQQLVWSGYPTGSGSYNENAIVAEVLTDEYDVNVRFVTSDTGVGRATPVINDQAEIGRLSDEAFYAFEAQHEFATADQGPVDLRAFWLPPSYMGFLADEDSGISAPEDLEGQRLASLTGNTSAQEKVRGVLAYAGLTEDDVEWVDVDYGDQGDALNSGEIDANFGGASSPFVIEAANQATMHWIDLGDPSDYDEEALKENAPTVSLAEFSSPVGVEEGESANGIAFPIQLAAKPDLDQEIVYELVTIFDEHIDRFIQASEAMEAWDPDAMNFEPGPLPLHEGLVRYLEEEGHWSEERDEANQALIERGERIRAGWEEVVESSSEDTLAEDWTEWKDENLD